MKIKQLIEFQGEDKFLNHPNSLKSYIHKDLKYPISPKNTKVDQKYLLKNPRQNKHKTFRNLELHLPSVRRIESFEG